MLGAGEIDRRVMIERCTETQDSVGQPVQTWQLVRTVWAKVTFISGREALTSSRVLSTENALFLMRHTSDLTPKDRLAYDGKYWNILNIREVNGKEAIEVLGSATS